MFVPRFLVPRMSGATFGHTMKLPVLFPRRRSPPVPLVLLLAGVAMATLPESPALGVQVTASDTAETESALRFDVVASDLEVPWDLEFTPDGRMFVTERPGRIRVVEDGRLVEEPWARLRVARASFAEAGLMGLALDPNFETNGRLYVCHSYYLDEWGRIGNRVVAYRERQGIGVEQEVLLEAIPGALFHDGCRLEFGPDGKLYVTTGDARRESTAQERGSLAGKILRIEPDGSVPDDNPYHDSPVWSLGHRNPQGIAWEPGTRRLFATEHGSDGIDELNHVVGGANYGWPWYNGESGDDARFVGPVLVHRTPPAGATFVTGSRYPAWRGDLLFGGLRTGSLTRVSLAGTSPAEVREHELIFRGAPGRIRDVEQGPEGFLYITTSNRDGRGRPRPGDDRILKILPPR